MDEAASIVIALLLIAVTAFFVSAEYAIIRVRRTRVQEMVEQNVSGARAVKQSLDHLDRYLSGTQLGVTMASLGLGWVGEPAVACLLNPVFNFLPIHSVAIKHTVATVIGFALVTFITVIFGELLPKWRTIQNTERTALALGVPMLVFMQLFYPLIWALERGAGLFAGVMGLNPSTVGSHEAAHSEDEIMAIVEAAHRSGTIETSEAEIVTNVFNFAHTAARKIMVPRVNIVTLSTRWSIGKNVEVAVENGFTRFPLVEENADHVIGMVHIKDLLAIAGDPNADIRSIRREMPKVPETKPIDELLREMQKNRAHQVIVMDEYGGTAGLVALEDVLEELVGEIQDEYDRPEPIEQLSADEFLVTPSVAISDIQERFGVEFDEEPEFETIGGYALHKLGLTHDGGGKARLDGFEITVAESKGNRIQRLRLRRCADAGEAALGDLGPA
ncbi:MAG: hemolysin family protein [Capsulimonadaceae bacterium]|nr:hemolysin family protein [Capsulimonadaceae bacterium]